MPQTGKCYFTACKFFKLVDQKESTTFSPPGGPEWPHKNKTAHSISALGGGAWCPHTKKIENYGCSHTYEFFKIATLTILSKAVKNACEKYGFNI